VTSPGLLVLRADAGPSIGAGHVMRCLALAQAWRRAGGVFEFVAREMPSGLASRIREEGGAVSTLPASESDALATAAVVRQRGARFVVIDGYTLTTDHHVACREVGARTLVVDDTGEHGRYECDLVLNQNLHASERFYARRAERCALLLGVQYTLLREEFLSAGREAPGVPARARKVLLSFGGADTANLSARAVEAVEESDLEAVLLVGAANPRRAEIEARAARSKSTRVLVDVRDVPGWMCWADVAVVAAGSTVWELAYMGVPSVVIPVADNQLGVAAGAADAGFAQALGHERGIDAQTITRTLRAICEDQSTRRAMSERGRLVIDGRGADRVAAALRGQE
jgi:UDP-2,4-diacetamido-2,4,6-trideoxy-beta-L-altropyranose hydrolase